MNKYKIEDLKVGAVFKDGGITRTILLVGKTDVFYSHSTASSRAENACPIGRFLRGNKGELVKPDVKTNKIKTRRGTLAWAMVQLVKGLKIRDKGWDKCEYLHFGPGSTKRTQDLDLIDGDGWHTTLSGSMGFKVWELYEEKEEKTK